MTGEIRVGDLDLSTLTDLTSEALISIKKSGHKRGICMKFKRATIKDFKHFTDLTIQGVPETARLIVLAGPNGRGKSSLTGSKTTNEEEKG